MQEYTSHSILSVMARRRQLIKMPMCKHRGWSPVKAGSMVIIKLSSTIFLELSKLTQGGMTIGWMAIRWEWRNISRFFWYVQYTKIKYTKIKYYRYYILIHNILYMVFNIFSCSNVLYYITILSLTTNHFQTKKTEPYSIVWFRLLTHI
jgi:hypothetical protein